jgi:glucose-6-phosphate isomerase
VEAGKKAAAAVLALQRRVVAALGDTARTPDELAASVGEADVETVFLILEHLAANGRVRIEGQGTSARFGSRGSSAPRR